MNNHPSLNRGIPAYTGIAPSEMNVAGIANAAGRFNIAPVGNGARFAGGAALNRASTQYEIFLFTQGTGIFESGYTRREVGRGGVLCIHPGSAYCLVADELQGYHISFSADFLTLTDVVAMPLLFKLFYHSNSEPLMDVIADDALETLIAVTAGMQKEYFAPRDRSRDILQGLFFVFMTYLPYASMPVKSSDFCDRLFEYASRFITLVKAHYHTHKQVADYARMMCVTPNFLNKVIKKKTGQTASRHIYDIVVLEAKKKAAFTTDSMKEIAYGLGFVDVYHFSKFFKKNSGVSFSRFRKEQVGSLPEWTA